MVNIKIMLIFVAAFNDPRHMFKSAYFFAFLIILFSLTGCAQNKFVAFNDNHISYEGRILYTADAAALMWCGTSLKINFTGTSVAGRFKDADTANYYNVIVDGKFINKIHFDTTKKTYVLVDNMESGNHSLELFKRTEWDKGKTFFYGFEFSSKTKILPPAPKPQRKMEFFGNSITCGYAIEDYTNDSPVGFFENSYDAYAAITARHFNAQAHYTAKSGIGITISWFPLLMKEMYDRLDPTDSASQWDFKNYIPAVVVINLFQNDAWITNMPDNDQFKFRFGTQKPTNEFIIRQYKEFVQSVRNKYPAAKIICMLGNMDITSEGSVWPAYVTEATRQLADKNIFTLFVPYKNTPGHPKTDEQKVLADNLVKFIETNIQW